MNLKNSILITKGGKIDFSWIYLKSLFILDIQYLRPLSCKPFGLQPTVLNTKLKFIDAHTVWVSQFFYKYMKVPIISCCIFGVCSEIQNLVLFGSAFRSKILITCCLLEIISVLVMHLDVLINTKYGFLSEWRFMGFVTPDRITFCTEKHTSVPLSCTFK